MKETRSTLSKENVGLVFCDRRLNDGDYRDLISAVRSAGSHSRIVVTSRHADWDEYLEAVRVGAFDAVASPCRPADVEWMVVRAKHDERATPHPVVAIAESEA